MERFLLTSLVFEFSSLKCHNKPSSFCHHLLSCILSFFPETVILNRQDSVRSKVRNIQLYLKNEKNEFILKIICVILFQLIQWGQIFQVVFQMSTQYFFSPSGKMWNSSCTHILYRDNIDFQNNRTLSFFTIFCLFILSKVLLVPN